MALADFGVSNIVNEDGSDKMKYTAGTYHFMSPESCNPFVKKKGYSGKKADVWALGVTLFSFTFLDVPFKGEDICELFDNIETMPLFI